MRNLTAKRMPIAIRLATVVGVACAGVLLVAACSSGGSSSAAGGAGAPSSSATGGAAAASSGASGSGSAVIATASGSGATFLSDGGRAVYMFAKDSGGKSACSGACASTWPPVTATGSLTGSGGVTSSDLGTITRSDGTKQVTYDGHPLYFYAGDSGPGMASGQGSDQFGAKWWLVSPSGSDVTATVTSFTTGGSGSSPAPSAPAATPSSSKASSSWG